MHASSRSGRTVALRQNLASRLLRELWFSFEIFRASCRHSAKCAPSSRRSFRGRIAKELVNTRLVHNTMHASSRSGRTVALRRMYNRARRSTAVRTKVPCVADRPAARFGTVRGVVAAATRAQHDACELSVWSYRSVTAYV
ncbi:hypothetical protein PUN28_020364 [Cardiocondyla obscurior]|uniref:Ribosomal protein L20 n=1 Tax=Cardiocondyla obscurior TaxID=286306 RepID=A0AAW2E6T5_9HYME